jgi:hypothetical protein
MTAASKSSDQSASRALPGSTAGRLSTGWLAVAMVVFAVIIAIQLKKQYPFVHNFHQQIDSPILAVELPGCANDLTGVLGSANPGAANAAPVTELFACSQKLVGVLQNLEPGDHDSQAYQRAVSGLRTNTHEDFVFIVLYNLFLWKFAALFAVSGRGKPTLHRKIMAGLVILTAAFDCLENFGILRALNASSLTDSIAHAIFLPSLCKWGLFGGALLWTGWILARSESPIYSLATRRLMALAYGSAGGLLLVGLAIPHVIELATDMFIMLVLANIIGLLGPWFEARFLRPNPPEYVKDFCHQKIKTQADVAVYPQNS